MKPYERQALLDRIEREGATVGASIPDRLTVQDEAIPLREAVLSLHREAPLADDREAYRRDLVIRLRRERTRLIRELETADIGRPTAERIVEDVVGIDRALEVLGSIGDPVDIEAEIRRQELAEMERWRSFLKRARGESPGRRRP